MAEGNDNGMDGGNFIELKQIDMIYGKEDGQVRALQKVDFSVQKGAFVAITGKSGCGKSTLLNVLGGILKPTGGSYLFEGKDVSGYKAKELARFRNCNVGFVVQHFALIPGMTVEKNIALPMIYHKEKKSHIRDRVWYLAELLDIGDTCKRYPHELSGGQKQRVAIARALAVSPKILLADEPTGALDEETGEKIMQVFTRLNRDGMTIVLVTHDLDLAGQCDRQVRMRNGQILEE